MFNIMPVLMLHLNWIDEQIKKAECKYSAFLGALQKLEMRI